MKIKPGTIVETDVWVSPLGPCNEWTEVKVHKVKGKYFWVENYKDDFKDDSQWKFDSRTMKSVNNYLPGSYKIARLTEKRDPK